MVKTSYLWTASDPAFAAVNGDDILPDLAIGRLPAANPEEARAMVEKILVHEDGLSHGLCQRNTLPSARRRGPGCSRRRSSERCTGIGGSSAACSPNIEMALAETDFQIARHYAERLYAILLTINGIPSGLRNTERSCIISLTGTLGRSGVLEEAGSSGRANADCQGHPRTASGFLLQL